MPNMTAIFSRPQCQVSGAGPFWWWVNIGSGNGLVSSGNKPSPEPMLTPIYVTI